MSCISTAGGIQRSRTRLLTGRSGSGQKKNVLVHKFICRGTVEEKIDALIDSKQGLSDELLTGGDEVNLTEMTNDDIMRMVSLDLNAAMKE